MKRAAILILLALAGCVPRTGEKVEADKPPRFLNPTIYEDRETGCQYLASGNSSDALTPRVSADAMTQMGCKGVEK